MKAPSVMILELSKRLGKKEEEPEKEMEVSDKEDIDLETEAKIELVEELFKAIEDKNAESFLEAFKELISMCG